MELNGLSAILLTRNTPFSVVLPLCHSHGLIIHLLLGVLVQEVDQRVKGRLLLLSLLQMNGVLASLGIKQLLVLDGNRVNELLLASYQLILSCSEW